MDDQALQRFIRRVPKAELHLHLEASAPIPFLRTMAARHETGWKHAGDEQIRNELSQFDGARGFEESFERICRQIRTPQDHLLLLKELEPYLEKENIRYVEVIVSPRRLELFGNRPEEVIEALTEEAQRFEEQSGRWIRWILSFSSEQGAQAGQRAAELAANFRQKGVVALGLESPGRNSLEELGPVFSWARAHELFLYVEAGGESPPEQIWDFLKVLGANRIGHGLQASRDARLMEYLREHAVGLDICLTGDQRTRTWPMLSDHPFQLLFRRGVPVTINTGYPTVLQTRLGCELIKAVESFALSESDLNRILLQGVSSSFLPYDEKMELMQQFNDEIRQIPL